MSCDNGVCLPNPPSGWQGFAYVVGESIADPVPVGPTCPDGSAPVTYFMDPSGPATCSACSCGALQGVGCNVKLLCSGSNNCPSNSDYTLNNGSCKNVFATPPDSCFLSTPQVTSQGSCPPVGGELTVSAPFKQVAHVCVAEWPGSCAAGGACVTPGTAEYAGYVCIYQIGEQTCPSDYSLPIITYKKATDDRACTACTCTPKVTGCTTGTYQFYNDGLCYSDADDITSTSCKNITVYTALGFYGYKRTTAPVGIGTCDVSGGVAQGSAQGDPAQAITYCCRTP